MTTDAGVDHAQLRHHVRKTFQGTPIIFGAPNHTNTVAIMPFGLGGAALGVLLIPDTDLTPRDGETPDDVAQRILAEGQRPDQAVLVFPHPFDALNGLLSEVQRSMSLYLQHNLIPGETVPEWEESETARINSERHQLRRGARRLLHALAAQNRFETRRAITALRPLCGFTDGSFNQFDEREAAAFGTPAQDRLERDAAQQETNALRDSLCEALGLTWDTVMPDDETLIERVRALRTALDKAEWGATRQGAPMGSMTHHTPGPDIPACPVCGGVHPERGQREFIPAALGHRPDCPFNTLHATTQEARPC